ncbi:MAG TPA: MFS transporter [Steroidobacteraceae bacterium]
MTYVAIDAVASVNSRIPKRLSRTASFYLQASITVAFLAGSSAPTPLYPLYQAQRGFSPIAVTIIFGIYALAVLSALLVAGRLSDHVGRRPVLFLATVAQAITMVIFATADSLSGLLIARVVQGLATGAAVAAVGAGLLDLDRSRGTLANAIAPTIGTATGAIVAGLMVRYLPAPTHLVYLILGVVFIAQAVGVFFMSESISVRAGAWASLKPQLALPMAVREPMLLAIPVLVAVWALAGFYGSLGPMLIRSMPGADSPLLGGMALAVLAASGALSVVFMQRLEPRSMMSLGASALLAGVAVTVMALSLQSIAVFFFGTAVAGVGFGAGFQGAIRTVMPRAAPHERAGVLSLIFVVSYLAMGLPAVVAGFLVVQEGSVFATAKEFSTMVMLLSAVALLGTVARRVRS